MCACVRARVCVPLPLIPSYIMPQVLVGTFLPNLELTKGFKTKRERKDETKPFWERLHVEKD